MKPTKPQTKRQPIKIIDGHKFYDIRQADEILHTRYMAAEIQEIYIRSGISEDFLKQISQLLIDRALESTDIKQLKQDMIAIGQNLQGRIGVIADRSMYEELACVFFMMDNEPDEYLPDWQARKKAIWAKERDFFILEVFGRINNSQNTSDSDILAVFQLVAERISQLPILPKK